MLKMSGTKKYFNRNRNVSEKRKTSDSIGNKNDFATAYNIKNNVVDKT